MTTTSKTKKARGGILSCIGITFLSLFLLPGAPAHAQKGGTYDGTYLLTSDISGQIRYEYTVEKGDTVRSGFFRFDSDLLETDNGGFKSKSFVGAYQNNRKNGKWMYHGRHLTPVSKPRFEQYKLTQVTSGTEYVISGAFEQGLVAGSWTSFELSIENSSQADTLFVLESQFDKGKYSGDFSARKNGITYNGSFDKEGFANGVWTYREANRKLEEHRVYEHGLLMEHYLIRSGDTIHVNHPGILNTQQPTESILFDEKYFAIMGFAQIPDAPEANKLLDNSSDFLSKALSRLHIQDGLDVWGLTTGSEPVNLPLVTVRKFPFQSDERQALSEFELMLTDGLKVIKNYLSSAPVEVNRFAVEEVAYFREVMLVYDDVLCQFKPILEEYKSPAFEYIDREVFLSNQLPQFSFPDQIQFEFKGKSLHRSYDFPKLEAKGNLIIEKLNFQLTAIYEDLLNLEKKAIAALGKSEEQSLLAEKEQKIISQKDSIADRFGNKNRPDFNSYHQSVAPDVLALSNQLFLEYADLNHDKKIDQIDGLIACYEELLNAYSGIALIPQQKETLAELYSRTVWNPYTFTYMEERVKERLYKAYDNQVFPQLVGELSEAVGCGNLLSQVQQIETFHEVMVRLREVDTKELERQIRRAGSLEDIKNIIANSSPANQ